MPPALRDSGRLCPACGYNLTGSDGWTCPECGVTIAEAEARRGAVEAWDFTMSLMAPPVLIVLATAVAIYARAWWLKSAAQWAVLALVILALTNDARLAYRWADEADRPAAQRLVATIWFTFCFAVTQIFAGAVVAGCLF